MNKLNLYRLELIVFLGGALGMIIELVGSRVVSPYFGNSLIVWTNLIGVILGSLSAGYYFGGRYADKEASYSRLEQIIFLSSIFLTATAFFKEPVLGYIQTKMGLDLGGASFTSILVLFGPVSFLLGMIAPMAAKLRIISLKASGTIVGSLYALSTFGSITGTFLAGFVLIPGFGNGNLLYGLSFSLVVLSSIPSWRVSIKQLVLLVVISMLFAINRGAGLFKLSTLEDIDSLYNRIIIREFKDQKSQNVTMMSVDNAGVQSAIIRDNKDYLYLDYTRMFLDLGLDRESLSNLLVIGGGGYSIPRYVLDNYPDSGVDVVEIDEEITRMAHKYFFLEPNARLSIFHQDARSFVKENRESYSAVLLDAFNSITPPPHLTTREFMEDLKYLISEDGVLIINMISALKGNRSEFLAHQIATLQSVFSDVRIVSSRSNNLDRIQNIYLLAYNNTSVDRVGQSLHKQAHMRVLTDDWSPVEFLTRNYYR